MDNQPTEVNNETEMPIAKQPEIERTLKRIHQWRQRHAERQQRLKVFGFWAAMIAGYGAAFAVPSIMAFINPPSTTVSFDIIGFFVNMSDEKRIEMLLDTIACFLALIALNTLNRRK